jgi:hypothetical protein
MLYRGRFLGVEEAGFCCFDVVLSRSSAETPNKWVRDSRTMALGPTQPLTEMSTRNLLEDKGRPARKADNLTAICEPIL